MGFDFDAFAGALSTLSRAIDETSKTVRIPRAVLADALRGHALARGEKAGARFWKSAKSEEELGKWIYRQARNFNSTNEGEILILADKIPAKIRRSLIEIAKSIPASRGGKQPKLDFIARWQVRKLVKELHDKGFSKDKAYEEVARRMHVSAHTVRRICDERERKRRRYENRTSSLSERDASMR